MRDDRFLEWVDHLGRMIYLSLIQKKLSFELGLAVSIFYGDLNILFTIFIPFYFYD